MQSSDDEPDADALYLEDLDTAEADDPQSVAAFLYGKHRHSTSAESRQVCAVLDAVLASIQEQELRATPVAVFAAVLSSLQHEQLRESAEVRTRTRTRASFSPHPWRTRPRQPCARC